MREVITGDGRTLAVEEWGVEDGTPVVYAAGSPMSRLARYPDPALFTELGVRLITYDRPGVGRSDARPGRVVADAADDIEAIADHLGLGRFPLFGVSGGGPHALAFAAAHPTRVSRVATLAAIAPRDADGLDWTAGMMEGNVLSAKAALLGREAVEELLLAAGTAAPPQLPPVEAEVLARPEVREMIGAAFAEGVRPGVGGWVDDVMALFGKPWGFDPGMVMVPVLLWHGGVDSTVPVTHAHWLAERMPGADVRIDPTAGHAGHFDATPEILRWLLRREDQGN
ncbi:alpha/beta hydrolase [Phytomonospora sp. NPDC050363]|uniref:alpha/beta fold hydrolase n=1 Tax=Phytomonospora sp. NPDC050363 TaxID=3155642 RepID=UPI0033C7FF38